MSQPMHSQEDAIEAVWSQRDSILRGLSELSAALPHGHSRDQTEQVRQAIEACTHSHQLAGSSITMQWLPTLLAAGEQADGPSQSSHSALTQLPNRALRLAHAAQRERTWRRLWLYPALLLALLASVFFYFCVVVIPSIQAFFIEFGLEEPALTTALFSIARTLGSIPAPIILALSFCFIVVALLAAFFPAWMLARLRPLDRFIAWLIGTRQLRQIHAWHDLADFLAGGMDVDVAVRTSLQRMQHGTTSMAVDWNDREYADALASLPPSFAHTVARLRREAESNQPISIDIVRAWASVYEDRMLRQTAPRVLYLVNFALNFATMWLIALLITAVYAPIVQLIEGLG